MNEEHREEIEQILNPEMKTEQINESIKKKQFAKKKLSIIATVAVVLAALTVCVGIYNRPENRLARQLDLSERYREEQSYEQAIVEFNKAIVIDPMCVDSYLGLADAYLGIDDYETAAEVLQKGYELTADERLKLKWDSISNFRQITEDASINSDLAETYSKEEEQEHYVEVNYNLLETSILGCHAGQFVPVDIHAIWKENYNKNFIYEGLVTNSDDEIYKMPLYDDNEALLYLTIYDWTELKKTIWWVNLLDISYSEIESSNVKSKLSCSYSYHSEPEYQQPYLYPIENKWISYPFDVNLTDSYDVVVEQLQVNFIRDQMEYVDEQSLENDDGSSCNIKRSLFNTQYGEMYFYETLYNGDNWAYDYSFRIDSEEIGVSVEFGFNDNVLTTITIEISQF